MKRYLVMLAATALFLTGCSGRTEENTAERVINVKVETVEVQDGVDARTYVGTVSPSKSAVLSCRHSGTLSSLAVVQGQRVSKGDVIAVIESETVKSSLEMVQAQLDRAKDGYERLKKVYDSGSVPEVKMVEIETQLAQAEASMRIAQQAFDDCTVRAPYSGVVSDVFVDEGVETAVAEPLVRVVDISTLEITIPVPESEIGKISIGSEAVMNVPALDGADIACRITKKGISASPLSHSYECTLKPVGDAGGLMPGMVCKVRLAGEGEGKIVIPAAAVKTGAEGRYVWTVENGRAKRADITVDGFSGTGIIVTSGLQSGDKLITVGAQKVSNGMKVNEVQ